MDPVTIAALIAGGVSLSGYAGNWISSALTNRKNREREDNAVARRADDLRTSGFNVLNAVSSPASASALNAPQIDTSSLSDLISGLPQSKTDYKNAKLQSANLETTLALNEQALIQAELQTDQLKRLAKWEEDNNLPLSVYQAQPTAYKYALGFAPAVNGTISGASNLVSRYFNFNPSSYNFTGRSDSPTGSNVGDFLVGSGIVPNTPSKSETEANSDASPISSSDVSDSFYSDNVSRIERLIGHHLRGVKFSVNSEGKIGVPSSSVDSFKQAVDTLANQLKCSYGEAYALFREYIKRNY